MSTIVTVQDAVTAFADFMEPTNAELDAIEQEAPLILAEVDLLDAQIIALHHAPNEVDAKRLRRAFGKVLHERRVLANRTATDRTAGGAA
ncbi:DUF6284 family protein [Streptomyces caniscabiei]|uniref:DUF6284 family protein n=1 Tax=Streptomyces caniscabiei TaxID=2746961 RepID=A0ABU4N4M8_9ACTN|nr:DUF6284 family protein [Streptomyces caniscabiei]MBE4740457.1 hypothetical protein [Streptomyces caniscabiei]MBE4761268.1 hypothetical protein [Streptomyces caniscabiei]MBE4773419.1 hypothetical protein [Streptomyces caniscabiei]MBE4790134.1 hypothetical protein [Streptomyces caniscabiei]MBE4799278.1 hypothetical protein [Streptomyces caniscabiei]